MLSDHLKAVFFVSFLVLLYTLYIRLGNVSIRRFDPELSSETLSTTLATNKDSSSKTYLLGEGRNEFLQTDSSEPLQSIQPSFSSSQDHLVERKTRLVNVSRSHRATMEVSTNGNEKEIIRGILSTSESVNYISQPQSVIVESLAAQNMYDPPPKSTGEGIPVTPIMATKSTVVTAYGAAESNTLNHTCYADVLQNMKPVCHPMCLSSAFSLPGMSECHPLLTCQDILSDITRVKQIAEGVVKRVFVGNWISSDF